MLLRRASPFFLKRISVVTVLGVFFTAFLLASINLQPVEAASFPVSPPVQVNTATAAQNWPGGIQGSCTYQSYFYAYWVDASNVLWMSSSSNGATWSTPTSQFTLINISSIGATNGYAEKPFQISCTANWVVVAWTWIPSGASANNHKGYIYWEAGTMSGGSVIFTGTIQQGPRSNSGSLLKNTEGAGSAFIWGGLEYLNGFVWYNYAQNNAGGFSLASNGVVAANISSSCAYQCEMAWSGSTYILYGWYDCKYGISADGITWPTFSLISATWCVATGSAYTSVGITATSSGFYVPTETGAGASDVLWLSPGGTLLNEYQVWSSYSPSGEAFITTDTLGDFAAFFCAAGTSCHYTVTTTNFATTAGTLTTTFSGGTFGASAAGYWSWGTGQVFSQTLEAFGVESATTSAPYQVLETVFGIPQSLGPTQQTQTLGSCPTALKGHAHYFALTNNTQFWYSGNALGSEVVNTVQTEVASIKGIGSHTLNLALYGTSALISPSQAPSIPNPATLLWAKSFVITTGTVNSTIVVQVNIPLNSIQTAPLPFNFWAVSVSGDDHINVYNSTLSGMVSQSGLPTVGSQYTSSGTTSADKFDLCATASYQSFYTQSVVTTITSTSVSTVQGSSNPAVIGNSNFMLAIVVILGPAILLAGATKSLWGGMLGAVLGIAVGWFINLPNIWALTAFVSLALIALLFLGQKNVGSPGGGGL